MQPLAGPEVMNGRLLKALMGPYAIMNTWRRARALIVSLLYLDTLEHFLTGVLETAALSEWQATKQIDRLLVTDG